MAGKTRSSTTAEDFIKNLDDYIKNSEIICNHDGRTDGSSPFIYR